MTEANPANAALAGIFDRAAPTYGRSGADFFGPAGRRLVACADVRPGEHVLDAGAGAGACTIPAADAVGPTGRVTAVDFAPGMVARLRETIAARGWRHVEAQVADAGNPRLPEQPLDVVIAGFSLFFLPDLSAALRRYAAVLRPGGRLAASWFGPDDDRWNPVFVATAGHIPQAQRPKDRGIPPQFSTPATLAQALDAAGFTQVRTLEEPYLLTFPDDDTWYAWSWSHGQRALWELVPAGQLADARRDTLAALDPTRDTSGRPCVRLTLRYTTAMTPTMASAADEGAHRREE